MTDTSHLAAERMQALLDGSLPSGEAEAAAAHVASCARCSAELDAWRVLFEGLDGLGEVAPPHDFTVRVLESLPASEPDRVPLAARLAGWVGLRRPTTTSRRHVAADRLQDFLEGQLPAEAAARVERHLDGCRFCRDEARAWRSVMVALDELPQVAPSPAFQERVMAHVRVQTAASLAHPTARERIRSFLGGLSPRTRKRAAAMAGALVTPTVTVALMAWTVFSHPQVTVGGLVSFTWFKAQEWAGALGSALLGTESTRGLVESLTAFRAWSLLEFVSSSPTAAAAAFGMAGCLTLVALWVLYRNLFATEHVGEPHARVSF
jgi:anti-sigma factor RsiW